MSKLSILLRRTLAFIATCCCACGCGTVVGAGTAMCSLCAANVCGKN